MAALPKIEVATGAIDGSNVLFSVSSSYRPLSVAVFLNGQLKRKDFADGWTETSPALGRVTLSEAPIDGDVVQIYFVAEGSGVLPDVVELSPLHGMLVAVEDLAGHYQPVNELSGALSAAEVLAGTLQPDTAQELRGTLEVQQGLTGTIRDC